MIKDPIQEINKIAAEMGLGRVSGQKHRNSIRYWQKKGDFFTFAYTPWKQADGKYYALKYRSGKIVKSVSFARRKKAKERAYKWFLKRREVLERLVAKRAVKLAFKPSKPKPTKVEILTEKLLRIQANMKKMESKKKRLETLLKKRRKFVKSLLRRIEALKESKRQ